MKEPTTIVLQIESSKITFISLSIMLELVGKTSQRIYELL